MSRRIVVLLALTALTAGGLSEGPPPLPPDGAAAPGHAHVSAPAETSHLALEVVAPPVADAPRGPYIDNQLMVAPPEGTSLAQLAVQLDARVVADVGRSGFGVLSVTDVHAASSSLLALGASTAPHAVVVGAKKDKNNNDATSTASDPAASSASASTAPEVEEQPLVLPEPWVLADAMISNHGTFGSVVVAVVDSGVAYETREGFLQAPGLSGVDFVAPADFIELDGHPNDDHQHGTHIASIIASEGVVRGIAPGVSLMPIKVLNHQNQGTEWALVEGIHHAIDHGADVINMSLSFPLGYLPSPALIAALERAHLADIVLVGAAGNDGAKEITWPAASRVVIGVGSSNSDPGQGWHNLNDYSNRSPALDILAPGGSLHVDENGDGFLDGILAETIHPANPAEVSLWFYEGTSHAAAVVSGAVVHLLDAGIRPADVGATLQQSQGGYSALKALADGAGASDLNLRQALETPALREELYVGLLPFAVEGKKKTTPAARVVATDDLGEALAGATVMATVHAADTAHWTSCETDLDGVCVLYGPASSDVDAWAFRVETVVNNGVASAPSRLLFASDAAEVLLQSIHDASGPPVADERTSLAVHWDAGYDAELDHTLVESWSVVDSGTGLLSSPLGMLFLPTHLAGFSQPGTLEVDPDGTGLLSSPLGFRLTLRTLQIDGTGLLSSPLGFQRLRLVGITGTGLLSSPLGFHASQLYAYRPGSISMLGGTGLLSSPLGFSGQPIFMDRGVSQISLFGSAYEAAISPGGSFTSASGYESPSWLVASGLLDVGLALAPSTPASSGSDEATALE